MSTDQTVQLSIASGKKSGTPSGIVLTITDDALPDEMKDNNGTAPCQTDGGDIWASSDADGNNRIPMDLVQCLLNNNPTLSLIEIKVNLDDLVSDTLYLHYHSDSTDSQPAEDSTYGSENVYPLSYVASYPMHEDPSGSAPQIRDRTSNDHDGTSNGSMTSGDVVSGQLVYATDFDGTNDYISVGDIGITGDWSAVFWANVDTSAPVIQYPLGLSAGKGIFVEYSAVSDSWGVYDGSTQVAGTNLTESTWYQLAVTKSGTTYNLYRNGSSDGSGTLADIDVNNLTLAIGNGFEFDGKLDNVSILNTVLDSDEIATLYNCESNNETFWDVTSIFDEVGSGGAVVGGSAIVPTTHSIVAAGGVVCAGVADVDHDQVFSEIPSGGVTGRGQALFGVTLDETATGGAVCAGVADVDLDGNIVEIGTGGAISGGAATVTSAFSYIASGGAIVPQPEFSTGYTHRIKVTVPSGKIAEDLNMLLAVRIDATPNTLLVTDSSGRTLPHEIRETSDTDTALVFGCALSSTNSNDFFVYFDHEG